MSRREKLKLLFERLVLQLWLCAIIAFCLKAAWNGKGEAAEAARSHSGPPLCSGSIAHPAIRCSLDPNAWAVKKASGEEQGSYLVRSALAPPCPYPNQMKGFSATSRDEAVRLLETMCGYSLPPNQEETAAADDGDAPHTHCRLRMLPADRLTPDVSVVAGPFDREGNLLQAKPEPPYLSIVPAVSVTQNLLDLVEAKEWTSTPSLLDSWRGSAFSGWLVVPLVRFDVPKEDLLAALSLLRKIGRSVDIRPRPQPVVIDLAGLAACPSEKQLNAMRSDLEGIGFKSFGYRLSDDPSLQQAARLSIARENFAVVISMRVTRRRSSCSTLPAVEPANLLSAVMTQFDSEVLPVTTPVVLLHWMDQNISPEERTAAIKELLDNDIPLVLGFGEGPVGPALAYFGGLGVANAGMFVDERSILPSAFVTSGLFTHCTRLNELGQTCSFLPVAQTLGEPAPVPGLNCRSCNLLPHDYFRAVWNLDGCAASQRRP